MKNISAPSPAKATNRLTDSVAQTGLKRLHDVASDWATRNFVADVLYNAATATVGPGAGNKNQKGHNPVHTRLKGANAVCASSLKLNRKGIRPFKHV